jgi:hypothetical protein
MNTNETSAIIRPSRQRIRFFALSSIILLGLFGILRPASAG